MKFQIERFRNEILAFIYHFAIFFRNYIVKCSGKSKVVTKKIAVVFVFFFIRFAREVLRVVFNNSIQMRLKSKYATEYIDDFSKFQRLDIQNFQFKLQKKLTIFSTIEPLPSNQILFYLQNVLLHLRSLSIFLFYIVFHFLSKYLELVRTYWEDIGISLPKFALLFKHLRNLQMHTHQAILQWKPNSAKHNKDTRQYSGIGAHQNHLCEINLWQKLKKKLKSPKEIDLHNLQNSCVIRECVKNLLLIELEE